MINRPLIGIALVVFGGLSTSLQAQVTSPNSPTAEELAALPRDCRSRVAEKLSPQLKKEWDGYSARHGRAVWDHYHHYCFALNFMNRTPLATLKKDKRYLRDVY